MSLSNFSRNGINSISFTKTTKTPTTNEAKVLFSLYNYDWLEMSGGRRDTYIYIDIHRYIFNNYEVIVAYLKTLSICRTLIHSYFCTSTMPQYIVAVFVVFV